MVTRGYKLLAQPQDKLQSYGDVLTKKKLDLYGNYSFLLFASKHCILF
jgi:hypothetical protein